MKKSKDKKQKETPKKSILEDTIGRDKFIEKAISLINFSNNTKAWHFAIDGEWGAGKSFVLNMIEDRLQDREDIVYIKYDAWKNDFYEDPIIAILYTILDSATLDSPLNTIIDGVKTGIEAFSAILNLIPGFNKTKKGLSKVLKSLLRKRKKSDEIDLDKKFHSYIDALNTLKEKFQEITQDKKLVILVDEIDRCSPDYSLKVLNRLHNLFDLPKVIVLTAVNKNILEATIKTTYGVDGKEYLTKIFDLTLKLNNFGDKKTHEIISRKFLSTILPNLAFTNTQIELYTTLIQSYSNKNPRKSNHTFEIFTFLFNNLRKENKNFSFLLFLSYLWFATDKKNDYIRNIANASITTSPKWLIKDFGTPNNYFDSSFGKYLEGKTVLEVYDYELDDTYFYSREKEINEFISLVNLFRYSNYESSLTTINRLYRTKFNTQDLIEISKLVDLIKVITMSTNEN